MHPREHGASCVGLSVTGLDHLPEGVCMGQGRPLVCTSVGIPILVIGGRLSPSPPQGGMQNSCSPGKESPDVAAETVVWWALPVWQDSCTASLPPFPHPESNKRRPSWAKKCGHCPPYTGGVPQRGEPPPQPALPSSLALSLVPTPWQLRAPFQRKSSTRYVSGTVYHLRKGSWRPQGSPEPAGGRAARVQP